MLSPSSRPAPAVNLILPSSRLCSPSSAASAWPPPGTAVAAGGAVLAAAGGLPAWARPTGASHHRRKPDSLPFPHMPAGTPSMKEIKHIVVLMMENHSFDNLLGMVPHQLGGRHGIDGLTVN